MGVIVSEGLPAQRACRVVGVSESGYYAWRSRPPSARTIRHAWLTDLIRQIHKTSRDTYGAPRVHAELTMGHGVTVGHNAVAMLMRRAGLAGLPGNRCRKPRIVGAPSAADLVDRDFARKEPDQLWVTNITEHRTPRRQGLLRGGTRRVQPTSGRLVHRLVCHRRLGHLRARYGDQQPSPGRNGDPFRPRHPRWIQLVVATPRV